MRKVSVRIAAVIFSAVIVSQTFGQSLAPPDDSEGFSSLFDGHTLEGWHVAPRIGVPKTAKEALIPPGKPPGRGEIATAQALAKGRWVVQEGVIVGGQDEKRILRKDDGTSWGLGSWLMSDATFGDFELQAEARPDWPCDTGIYVRCTELGQGFQILLDHRGDDTDGIGGNIGFLFLRGIGGLRVSPYNFHWQLDANGEPSSVNLAPDRTGWAKMDYAASSADFLRAWHFHDWNRFRIRVVGNLPRITVWINEVKICECDTAAIEHADYEKAEVEKLLGNRGHIAFEVHDGPPWRWGIGKVSRWRHIAIKKL